MRALSQVIVTLTTAMAITAAEIPPTTPGPLDLTPQQKQSTCITKSGTKGICVNHNSCSESHTILPGGNILPFELREKSGCSPLDWCCSLEEYQPPKLNVTTTTNEKCQAAKDDGHSWFVALFKSSTGTQSATSLFCAGALVTSRVVLTSATCIRSAKEQLLYVQVPASGSQQNYTVLSQRLHHSYNSGTHINDFGILVLDKDVDWGKEKEGRVCLDFQTQSKGVCFTVGFAEGAEIETTILSVQTGGCRLETNETGVSCGTNDDSVCIVTPGAPVLCLSKDEAFTVVGVTKTHCRNEKVPIGDISSVSMWLEQELSAINIVPNIYTYNKS